MTHVENTLDEIRQLYLDLMKKCLTDMIYRHIENPIAHPRSFWGRKLVQLIRARGMDVVKAADFNEDSRRKGLDWPTSAHTMIGIERLNNLQACVEDVLRRDVPGDLIETGVWRGGATIFMRAVLKAYNVTDRLVWVADSFEGLPPPNASKYPNDAGDIHSTHKQLVVSLDEVKANFERYGLLDDHVRFIKGWFRDTLPTASIKQLAVLRLDGDMYESTMDGLTYLYPKLSKGGYVIIDDYGAIPACREAVHDYRNQYSITEELVKIDWTGVYWKRG